MSTVRAVVLEVGGPGLRVRDITTPTSLDASLVRVSLRAAGVCHSDLHVVDGDWPAQERWHS